MLRVKQGIASTARTLLLIIVAYCCIAQSAQAATPVSGAITANTTWTLAQSPYQVTADVSVDNAATLTIDAGVVVAFDATKSLTITNGALIARGTAGQPITFTSSIDSTGGTPAPGDWGQIRFLNASNDSTTIIEHAQIRYGQGITVQSASPTFNHLQITNNQGTAISIDLASSPKGVGNQASGNTLNGISVPAGEVLGDVTWGIKGIPYLVASGTVSIGSTPILNTLSISEIQQSDTISAILSGSRLTGAQNISFSKSGITAIVQSGATDTSVPVQLSAEANATLGTSNIELQVAAGHVTLAGALQVIQPQPTVTSLNPNTLYATRTGSALTVTGKNFVPASVIRLDGTDLTTTYGSVSSLSTTLPLLTPGSKSITVKQPDPLLSGIFLISKPAVLTVAVPPLSISPATASQIQGIPFNLTVSIPFAAPAGGLTVNLRSSATAIATVPASIAILEGATTASVPVTAVALGATVITASTTGFASTTANITVNPLPSLSITPSILDIGAGRNATLTIASSKVAGTGGQTVALTSSNPAVATVPTSVVIAAGASSATVQLNALATGATTVSAQADIYTSGSSAITVHALTMSLPTGAVVSPGVTRAITLTLSDVAPTGGLVVNLTSSNTSVMTVPASVTVLAGQKTISIDITGVALGSATLTATADAYQTATSAITVDTINISLGIGNISLLLNGTSTYDVTLSSPAPAGGLVVSLAIADPTIATVTPATITIPAGQTTGGAVKATVKAVTQGATTLTANASGVNATTVSIDVSGQVAGIDLVVSNATIGTVVANQNGSFTIPVTYTVTNNGTVTAQPNWSDRVYLSTDGVLSNTDQALSGLNWRTSALAVGASYTVTVSYTSSTTTTPGAYTLFVKTDGHPRVSDYPYDGTATDTGNLVEANEANNTQALPITLSAPDLVVSNATIGMIVSNQDGTFTIPVTYTVTNNGTVPAQPYDWYDRAFLSSDGVLDNADQALSGFYYRNTVLDPGASYTVTVSFTPSAATVLGAYTLFVKTDAGNTPTANGNLAEANDANNTQGLPVTLSRADMAVSNASIGAIVPTPNGAFLIPVTFTVINNGTVAAQPNWCMAYLSSDGMLDNADQELSGFNYRNAVLAPGANYTASVNYITSAATVPGAYTLFVKADGLPAMYGGGTATDNGMLVEADETNNTQALPVTLMSGGPLPDLVISNAMIGTAALNSYGSYLIPVTYTVTNNGTVPAQPNWYDMAYLSDDGVLDNSDQVLGGSNYRNTVLAPGASYTVTTTFGSSTAVGNYTLFVKTDSHSPMYSNSGEIQGAGGTATDSGNLVEVNEANNAQAIPINLIRPDLVVSNASIGTIVVNQNGSLTLPVTYTVTNNSTVTAQPCCTDMAFLSVDGVLDDSDQLLNGGYYRSTVLAPGESYTATLNFINYNAAMMSGAYTLFVKTDNKFDYGYKATGNGNLVEADETNNAQALPVTLNRTLPDLAVSNFSIDSAHIANSDGSFTISATYTVTNNGTAAAQPTWYDYLYLSSDGVLDDGDQELSCSYNRSTPLDSTASYTATMVDCLTSTGIVQGNYTLFVKTDLAGVPSDNGRLMESNEANNTQSLPVTLVGGW